MSMQNKVDGVFAWITGIVTQFLVIETLGSVMLAVLMAGAGGFAGYVGKELGARLVKRIFKKSEQIEK